MPWRREVVERMRLLVWEEVVGWPMRVVRVSRRREATGGNDIVSYLGRVLGVVG